MKIKFKKISGWGNHPIVKAKVLQPDTIDELIEIVKDTPSLLARGSGMSYGDSSLNNVVVDMKKFNEILYTDNEKIEAQAGITIEQILKNIIPKNRFLPVTPGIKSITIGGAIASDVHGKNHIHDGSFFNHTQSFKLLTGEGKIINCSRLENKEIFVHTFGGMGLQGIIISAVLNLMPIENIWIYEEQQIANSLTEIFSLMENSRNNRYMATWIDLSNKRISGIVKTGNWLAPGNPVNDHKPLITLSKKLKSIPFKFPLTIPRFLFRWYNLRYLEKAKKIQSHIIHYNDFFYPLDNIKNWNDVYGPKGIIQYHFVLPLTTAQMGISKVIELIKSSKVICTLAVMKLFGKGNDETPNSFPMEGYNLALDFVNNKNIKQLISDLDNFIYSFDGRVYKTKDALSTIPKAINQTSKFNSLQNERYASKKRT